MVPWESFWIYFIIIASYGGKKLKSLIIHESIHWNDKQINIGVCIDDAEDNDDTEDLKGF